MAGVTPFSHNTQTYYTTARMDVSVSQKIRVFGSWLYEYQRQAGEGSRLDSTTGLFNISTGCLHRPRHLVSAPVFHICLQPRFGILGAEYHYQCRC